MKKGKAFSMQIRVKECSHFGLRSLNKKSKNSNLSEGAVRRSVDGYVDKNTKWKLKLKRNWCAGHKHLCTSR